MTHLWAGGEAATEGDWGCPVNRDFPKWSITDVSGLSIAQYPRAALGTQSTSLRPGAGGGSMSARLHRRFGDDDASAAPGSLPILKPLSSNHGLALWPVQVGERRVTSQSLL
jgi:hypothetical protein